MLYNYCDIIMTENSSHLINPDGRLAVMYSVPLFPDYSVLRHDVLLQKTYPLPTSECDYPTLRRALVLHGVRDTHSFVIFLIT